MSLPPGSYYQLTHPAGAELERKKSRFFAHVAPVQDRAAADEARAHMAARFPDCRHLCFAYVLGPPAKPLFTTAFDAGEPGGTAGRPMLNALLNHDLGDVVAVVARYFGGIKLGTGGLARAYAAAVNAALDGAERVVCEPLVEVSLTASYPLWERSQRLLAEHQCRQLAVGFGSEVQARLVVPARHLADLQGALAAVDHRVRIVMSEDQRR